MAMRSWLAAPLVLLVGCSLQEGARGDSCTRTVQCAERLACIEGICTDDLSEVGARSMVPELPQPEGDGDSPDAGADAAVEAPGDAAIAVADDDAG